MKKGILYNLFKIYNRDLSDCISELNVSVESAAYHNYPKCLLLSNKSYLALFISSLSKAIPVIEPVVDGSNQF